MSIRRTSFALAAILAVPTFAPSVAHADPPAAAASQKPAAWGAAPADKDKDGIPDNVDACPDVPGVKTNEAKTNGCPNNPWGAPAGASDRDGDRVPDATDACPDQVGVRADDPKAHGCPPGKPAGVVPEKKALVVLKPAPAPAPPPPPVASAAAAPPAAPEPVAPPPPPPAPVKVWYKPWTWF